LAGSVSAFFGGLHIGGRRSPAGSIRNTGRGRDPDLPRLQSHLLSAILGVLGMPRRYHVYPPELQVWNVLSSAGASILALAYVLPLFYLGWSLFFGRRAGP
jgi:cytochrome c oxidase subunit 1